MLVRDALFAYAAVPVPFKGKTNAAFTVQDRVPRRYTLDELNWLQLLGRLLFLGLSGNDASTGSLNEWQSVFVRLEHLTAKGLSLGCEGDTSKWISPETLDRILGFLKGSHEGVSIRQIADNTSLTTVSVRRYLKYLVARRVVRKSVAYGNVGRPKHIYHYVEG